MTAGRQDDAEAIEQLRANAHNDKLRSREEAAAARAIRARANYIRDQAALDSAQVGPARPRGGHERVPPTPPPPNPRSGSPGASLPRTICSSPARPPLPYALVSFATRGVARLGPPARDSCRGPLGRAGDACRR